MRIMAARVPLEKNCLFVFKVQYESALGIKNKNLWESLGGIIVNGALGLSLEYSMYSLGRILKAPFGIF